MERGLVSDPNRPAHNAVALKVHCLPQSCQRQKKTDTPQHRETRTTAAAPSRLSTAYAAGASSTSRLASLARVEREQPVA
jgi:hypothetical protein